MEVARPVQLVTRPVLQPILVIVVMNIVRPKYVRGIWIKRSTISRIVWSAIQTVRKTSVVNLRN